MEKGAKKTAGKKKKSPEITKLAKRIKDLRVAKGYNSAEAFALDNQLSRTHYGRWERGSNITYINLIKLAEAFDVTLEEFFGEGFD
jgi:transcriptional regulator with XRE-family HTH domain